MADTTKDNTLAIEDSDNDKGVRSIWDWFPTVEIAPIGVFRSTPDGRFSYVNQELAKIFEFESAQDMLEQVEDIATDILAVPHQRTHFKDLLEKNGSISDFIYDIKTRTNRIRQASLTARLVKTVDGVFYEGFLIDVTEAHETKLRLEDLLRDVQGMAYRCECKPPWRMLWISAGCGELTGYTPEDLLRNTPDYETLIHEDYREQVADAVAEALKTKTTYTLSYPIRTASTELKWVLEKGKVFWGHDGKPLYLKGFVTSANRITNAIARESREIETRREFQKIRFRAVLLWTFIIQFIVINLAVVIILLLKAVGLGSSIGEATLLGLTGQTVAQIAGLIYIIAKYLFTSTDAGGLTMPAHPKHTPHISTDPPPPLRVEPEEPKQRVSADPEPGEEEQQKRGKKVKVPPKG